MAIQQEAFSVQCEDGVILKGKLLCPAEPKAVVQFNAGTAAKKEFYQAFLEYLVEHDYLCCLWDYRGNGESAPASLADCTYTCHEYGMQDIAAVKSFLKNRFPTLPFFIVGHSAGGQQIGLLPDISGIDGMIAFAVSSGYLGNMPLGYRLQAAYFFYLFSPISIALTGYVAAKRFGIMEDLPRNVLREWRAWCTKPSYFFHPKFRGNTIPHGHFDDYNFPVHVYSTLDDTISSPKNVEAFWSNVHSHKGIEFTQLSPKTMQEKKIDHFGFFKKRMKNKLWPTVVEKLDSFLIQK